MAFRNFWGRRVNFLDVRAGPYRDIWSTSTAFKFEVFKVVAEVAFFRFGYVGAMRKATVGFVDLVVGFLAVLVAVVDMFAVAAGLERVPWSADYTAVGASHGRHVGS